MPYLTMHWWLLLAALAVTGARAQESWREARTYAGLVPAAPQVLAGGGVHCARVGMAGATLNLGTEAVYLLPVAPDQAAALIRDVADNPAEVALPLAKPVAADEFKSLTVTDASLKTAKGLNLSAGEKTTFGAAGRGGDPPQFNAVWRQLLLTRAAAFQTGGLLPAAAYELGGGALFQPAPELVGLLKQRAPVLRRFVCVMDEVFTGQPGANQPAVHYWADEKVQGNQNFALGAVHALKTADGWQLADLTYYSASSYYLSLTLYELWPVAVAGRAQTYVWRGDYVISPSIGHLKGIERMAAGNIMLLEVKGAIRAQIKRCATPPPRY
ncbi:MAG: hypothetical protein LBK60_11065 [Verrucomicrobiales bacterium]|nr:hypothetical protein [Verrucomicrobiales bacterium]